MSIFRTILAMFNSKYLFPSKKEIDDFVEEYHNNLRFVELNDSGFTIEKSKDEVVHDIKWHSVNDVEYQKDQLTFHLTKSETLVIPEEYHEGWYTFVKNIPKGFPSFDYNAVDEFFEQLQGCECCGLLAVGENGECLSCGEKGWNSEMAEIYDSREEYLREMQLVDFEPIEGEEAVIEPDLELGFKADPNWKPYVTKEDFKQEV